MTNTTAALEAKVNPQGAATTYRFEYGLPSCTTACARTASLKVPIGSSPVLIKATVAGLSASTTYHFRVFATNGESATSTFRNFLTRNGGSSGGPPDGRAYEQSSEVEKDGGDVVGKVAQVKAADDGNSISFASTFGIPGGHGAGALPTYLATRGEGLSGWTTQGLLPPPSFGERTRVLGWLPDFSETFAIAETLGVPRLKALVAQSTTSPPAAPPTVIAAYTPEAGYSYVGASAEDSTVFFEAPVALPAAEGEDPIEAAVDGKPNLYAWDRGSGRVSLVDVTNDEKAPPNGGFAGPYDWSGGINALALREGGSVRGYYLQGPHAITASGDIYFTEAGTGQLYLRLNPTQPQSAVVASKCTKEADACTIHVSASRRTLPDTAGSQPAAFQTASADGSKVFFTSPEKLTDNANTGPPQPVPSIGTASPTIGAIEDASFIPKRAVGVAVNSKYVYWADTLSGTIGRADLNGENIEENIIEPGKTECEIEVETEPGSGAFVKKALSSPSAPRYVALDAGNVYWSNTGLLDKNGEPVDGCGTIGRAELDGADNPINVEPEFITGASNPQGIGVNATDLYWANAAKDLNKHSIGRAASDGSEVKQEFFRVTTARIPYGVALRGDRVYFGANDDLTSYLFSISLTGEEIGLVGIGPAGIRGVAVDGAHVYWASQGENAIGRANLDLSGGENEFVEGLEGSLGGLAVDASHLYWSANGEAGLNPGNDLYRYEPGLEKLEDLTPLPGGNGAEVQGVLAASVDGSHVYFAANGDLDGGGPAKEGTCKTTPAHGPLVNTNGSCNVYLWQASGFSYVGRVKAEGSEKSAGVLGWTGTPRELISTAGYTPKSSFVSKDGETLLFSSQEKLTEFDNEGVPELYRYSASSKALGCVSCSPSGAAVERGPGLASIAFPGPIAPGISGIANTESRNLSANGNRAFFETAEALVPEDTNGQVTCPGVGPFATPACQDVYEWEAPGEGSCAKAAAAYSILNEGCVYLISTGTSPYPSYFADASQTGGDVFFFTRQSLVGQDKDELQDVYDARVEGGLPSQSPVLIAPCESAEACHGAAQTPPGESSPASATFLGPGDPKPKHPKPKAKKKSHKKQTHKKAKQKRAAAKGRTKR